MSHSGGPADPSERRYYPRVRLCGEVNGRPVPMQIPLVLQDISLGGFAVEGAIGFSPGAVHWFELTATVGWAMVKAICVHCVHADPLYGDVYFAGFEFDQKDEKEQRAVAALVSKVLA